MIKRSKVSLRNMTYIVAICIVLYKLHIVNNEKIEEECIIQVENKLARNVHEGEIQNDEEFREKKVEFTKVKRNIWAKEDAPIVEDKNDTKKIIGKNEKTMAFYSKYAKHMWQYKIRNKFDILFSLFSMIYFKNTKIHIIKVSSSH